MAVAILVLGGLLVVLEVGVDAGVPDEGGKIDLGRLLRSKEVWLGAAPLSSPAICAIVRSKFNSI